jgi:hypothetical protein
MQDKFGGYDKLTEALRGKDTLKNVKWLMTRLINEGADEGEEEVTENWVGKKIHAGNLKEIIDMIFATFNIGTVGTPTASTSNNDDEDDDPEDAENPNAVSGAV